MDRLKTGLASYFGSAVWWLCDKIWGDRVFALVKPMIPDQVINGMALSDIVHWCLSYGPTIILVAIGTAAFISGRRKIEALTGPSANKNKKQLSDDATPFVNYVKDIKIDVAPLADRRYVVTARATALTAISNLRILLFCSSQTKDGNWGESNRFSLNTATNLIKGDQISCPIINKFPHDDIQFFGRARTTNYDFYWSDIGGRTNPIQPGAHRVSLTFVGNDGKAQHYVFKIIRTSDAPVPFAMISDEDSKSLHKWAEQNYDG